MAENNLTTTARAVVRSAFGVKINDPKNAGTIITRTPDQNGVLDLSDLATSTPINIGDSVAVPRTTILDYQSNNKMATVELKGIKSDLSNIPNGLTVKHSKAPTNILVGSALNGCEIISSKLFSRESPISSSTSGLPTLTDGGVSFTKTQLKTMVGKYVRYPFKSSSLGSYMYLQGVPNIAMVSIKSAYFDYYFHEQDGKLMLDYQFNAVASSASSGLVSFLLDSITVY